LTPGAPGLRDLVELGEQLTRDRPGLVVTDLERSLRDRAEGLFRGADAEHPSVSGDHLDVGQKVTRVHGEILPADERTLPGRRIGCCIGSRHARMLAPGCDTYGLTCAFAPPAGFEPATHGLGNRRSIP